MKQNKNHRIIGITGRIATGKSTLAENISARGYVLLDADHIYHQLLVNSKDLQTDLIEYFGTLDRKTILNEITKSKNSYKKLNSITHSYVTEEIVKTLNQNKNGFYVLDVPVPVEKGFMDICDIIITTDCSIETQLERLATRNGLEKTEAMILIGLQMSRDEYRDLADYIINTDGMNLSQLIEISENIVIDIKKPI